METGATTAGGSEGQRHRLSVEALLIASASSVTAALLVSQLWLDGTLLAAGLTPVFVALAEETFDDPIMSTVRAVRSAFRRPAGGLPAAPEPAPAAAGTVPSGLPPQTPSRMVRVRKPILRTVVLTAVLAFAIGAVALTLPELIAGKSFGAGGGGTTLWSTAPADDDGAVANGGDCEDGADNDGDGLTDAGADPGCAEDGTEDPPDAPAGGDCEDGIDNDGDGLIDAAADAGCAEDGTEDPADAPSVGDCEDGIDNDGDGFLDAAGGDPGCADGTEEPFDQA